MRRQRGILLCFFCHVRRIDKCGRTWYAITIDRSYLVSSVPSRATSPARGPRSFAQTVSNFICVPRNAGPCNSIRRSRTEESLALQDWPGSVRLVLCVRTARMIEDGFTKQRMNLPSPVTSFISGRYASRLLDLPRESGEKIESRGRIFPRHAIQFSTYQQIVYNFI